MNKPVLSKASLEFYQEGNCLGSTSETEEIIIDLEGDDVDNGNFFYTIKTPTGWSIDNSDEFVELMNRVKQIINI